MDASRRVGCLSNTRTEIIKFIVEWVDDPPAQHNILWLHGLAGSGKSTLSTTIANIFGDSGRLGAFLFFDRDVTERSDPSRVISTLAHQLASSHPRIGLALRAVLETNSNILTWPISRQFQKLIFEPVLTIADQHPCVVVVLDALDECGTANDREGLLDVLASGDVKLPSYFRTIITSRADVDIDNIFSYRDHILSYELDITSQVNSDDILSYFRHRMSLIRERNRHLRLSPSWPGKDAFRQLVQRASGLFVWASTACEFINGYDPKRRLDVILRGQVKSGAQAALDALYRTALNSINRWDDEDFVSDFRDVMGIILVARLPLSSSAIDALLHIPDDRPSGHLISLLGCVLQQNPTIRVLHPSFVDFLMEKERCGRDIWFFDHETYHRLLALRCLGRMDVVLQQNMCNLTLSTYPSDPYLSEDISYSCSFWIDHACATYKIPPTMDLIRDFLFRHLLHWFEAMSILKRARETINLLDRLMDWISVSTFTFMVFLSFTACLIQQSDFLDNPKLRDLVYDACRFARSFAHSIEEHPLLVYMTALPFTPTKTTLYQTFHRPALYPSVLRGFQHTWPPLLQILAGHVDAVWSISVSPDGKKLASGSQDNTVRVWDAATGAEIFELQGHRGCARSVAFSPDGSRIVSGSIDATIRVWDLTTGHEVIPVLRGHENGINSVSYSPDGTMIVSGSDDTTLRLWNAITGAEMLKLRDFGRSIGSVIFSFDGSKLIWGADDHSIPIWDWRTAYEVSRLWGHEGWVRAITCSPDGARLVSGSTDKTVRVWDMATGAVIAELRGHESWVNSVAFSPDGKSVVSGSDDRTIRIWDVASGVGGLLPLQGHDGQVESVAFSFDGTKVISGSLDCTIRIWDVSASADIPPAFRRHKSAVRSLAFSSNGTKIVSGSCGGTLDIWDALSGAKVMEMTGHQDGVLSVSFSLDGHRIVSGSVDQTVRVWNATTGDEIIPCLRGHRNRVESVAFSLDGSRIASGSADATIRVWEAVSGAEIVEIRGHESRISSVIFTPDGHRIVSGSWDRTVRIWNVATGAQAFPALRGHTSALKSVFLSSDARRIISQSECESISWDAATGRRLYLTEPSDRCLSGSIVTCKGWIVDSATDTSLGKLPDMVADPIYMSHGKSLAVGTHSGRVLVLHFPLALFTGPDNSTVD
jgi:WD40 repeat protein